MSAENCLIKKNKEIPISKKDDNENNCDKAKINDNFNCSESAFSELTKNTNQLSHQEEKKRGKWTKEEDDILERVVLTYGQKSWKKVANFVIGRTPIQCLHRWTKILKPGLIKGPWTIDQDRKLLDWIKKEGPTLWSQCADCISGRSGKQCRERWFNTLCPTVRKGNWSPEEDFTIFDSYRQFGSHWTKIAEKLEGRTENSIKNRFYSTLRRISSRKKSEKIDDAISSSSIPLNLLVEFLPEALLEKTMNFIKFKNENKNKNFVCEKIVSEKLTVINDNNINVKNYPQIPINNNNTYKIKEEKINTQFQPINNYNPMQNGYTNNFSYNYNNTYPLNNNNYNDMIDKYNFDNQLNINNYNNMNSINNPYFNNNSFNNTSNIYNYNSNQNNNLNTSPNYKNAYNNNNNTANLNLNENKVDFINVDDYNQLKELPLDVLENNIENLCDRNHFNEPNINLLDNQINDFIDNFFENNSIQDELPGNNLYCYGCNDNKKNENVINEGIMQKESVKGNDKVLNSLLDQLNELEKLLHNSKSELIYKMNKINQSIDNNKK